MTTAFEPVSDHAKTLAEAAASKATTAKFAKGLSDGKQDLFRLNPFLINRVEGFNARDFDLPENAEHVRDLARSIASEGVKKPLEVRFAEDGQAYLVDGECRLRATILAINEYGAQIKTVPIILSPKGQNDEDRIASQFVSNSGKPFNELEAAFNVRRLLGFGWTEKQIAERGCMSAAKVARLIKVLELPEAVRHMIRQGEVSATLALDTVRAESTSEKAVAALKEGLGRATEAGRSKVTAKHVVRAGGASGAVSPASALSALREAFRKAEVEHGEGFATYTLSEAGAALVRQHFGV